MTWTFAERKAQELTTQMMNYWETFGDPYDGDNKYEATIDMFHDLVENRTADSYADIIEEDLQNNLGDFDTEEEFDNAYMFEWSVDDIKTLIEDLRNYKTEIE